MNWLLAQLEENKNTTVALNHAYVSLYCLSSFFIIFDFLLLTEELQKISTDFVPTKSQVTDKLRKLKNKLNPPPTAQPTDTSTFYQYINYESTTKHKILWVTRKNGNTVLINNKDMLSKCSTKREWKESTEILGAFDVEGILYSNYH